MAENWISLRAYARHRDCTLAAVQKAIASGRIPPSAVKRNEAGELEAIDQVAADAAWLANTDPVEAARSGTLPLVPPGDPGDQVPVEPGDGDPHGFLKARAAEKKHHALLAELEYLRKIGAVVDADEVRELLGRRYRGI